MDRLKGKPIDIAFLPMDSRLESHYKDGLLGFLNAVPNVGTVYPMHYWDNIDLLDRFLADHPQYQGVLRSPEAL